MSKKDYIAIAAIINRARQKHSKSVPLFQSTLVGDLIVYFASDNEQFDYGKFRRACYGEEKGNGKKME